MSGPFFDPRLSAVDLLEWFEDREAAGDAVEGELLAAFEAALEATDFITWTDNEIEVGCLDPGRR